MKLFQRLLVAPAAIGLLAPLTATATEANLNSISNYSNGDNGVNVDTFKPLSNKNPLLITGGEGMVDSDNDFSADSFSSTTTAAFSADFAVGSVDGSTTTDQVSAVYQYGIDLTTSFNGSDSLDVSLAAGNGGGALTDLDFSQAAEAQDSVEVSSLSYTFPLGDKTTAFVGFADTAGSSLYNTSCVYSGSATDNLSNCGNLSAAIDVDGGTSFGITYDHGNGLSLSYSYDSPETTNGLLTYETEDAHGGQIAYNKDSWGTSLTFARIEEDDTSSGSSYKHDDIYTAINAYFIPEVEGMPLPAISAGYEWGDNGGAATSETDSSTSYFVGVEWDEVGPGSLGAALGTRTPTIEGQDAQVMYEAFYSYNYADGITLTPMIFVKENTAAGSEDETGVVFKTSWSF